jgi:hypothetical protein
MSRYSDIPIVKSSNNKNIYANVKYPEIPLSESDLYILCNSTDRYDKLALSYYGDSSLWWVISIANNASSQDGLFPPLDVYIRVPQNPVDIISNFNKLNNLNIKLVSSNNNNSNNSSNNISTGY